MRHVLTEKAGLILSTDIRGRELHDYDENTIPAGIGEVECKVWPMMSALSLSTRLLLRGVDGYVMVRVA